MERFGGFPERSRRAASQYGATMTATLIPLFKVRVASEASANVAKVLGCGYLGQGPMVDAFEKALQSYLGHAAPLTLNSGTSGLMLALRLVCEPGTVPGEVLTQPITCAATNWSILAMGQCIRWVD